MALQVASCKLQVKIRRGSQPIDPPTTTKPKRKTLWQQHNISRTCTFAKTLVSWYERFPATHEIVRANRVRVTTCNLQPATFNEKNEHRIPNPNLPRRLLRPPRRNRQSH